MHVSLIEQFDEHVSGSVKFNTRYYDGIRRYQMSLLINFSNEDLIVMYPKFMFGGEIILRCDGGCREETWVVESVI